MKFRVIGSRMFKYVLEVEANSIDEAKQKVWTMDFDLVDALGHPEIEIVEASATSGTVSNFGIEVVRPIEAMRGEQ